MVACDSDLLVEYPQGALEPDLAVAWIGPNERLVNLTGHTFRLRIARRTSPTVFLVDKTTGFTPTDGVAGTTNLAVAWTAGEIDVLKEGVYAGRIDALDGTKPRPLLFTLKIGPFI